MQLTSVYRQLYSGERLDHVGELALTVDIPSGILAAPPMGATSNFFGECCKIGGGGITTVTLGNRANQLQCTKSEMCISAICAAAMWCTTILVFWGYSCFFCTPN